MASQFSTVEFILEQIAEVGDLSAKKMFGEYGIYCNGKLVALVCDDELFVKITPAGKAFIGDFPEKQPYPHAKPCFLIKSEKWDDRDWLSQLIKVSVSDLPNPKPSRKIRK